MTSPSTPHDNRRFLALPPDECWTLLNATPVGRIGFTAGSEIMILPVNFVVHNKTIYICTHRSSPIAALADGNTRVAFEADHHNDIYQYGWSVLIQGDTRSIPEDELERSLADQHWLGPWAPGSRTLPIAIEAASITGRRVSLH